MTDNMLLVGGGVGIAPMLCIASKLNEIEDTTRYTNEEDETVIKPVAAKKQPSCSASAMNRKPSGPTCLKPMMCRSM